MYSVRTREKPVRSRQEALEIMTMETKIDMTAEKAKIDSMSQIEMARLYRFTPIGTGYFKIDSPEAKELYDYFMDSFAAKGGMTTEVSKLIGW